MKNYVWFFAIISTSMAVKNAIPQIFLVPSAEEKEEGLKRQVFYKKNINEIKEMVKNPTNIFNIREELVSTYSINLIEQFSSKSKNLSQQNTNIKPLIMGGTTAFPGDNPYHAFIMVLNGLYTCGATIICKSWLLTTANCLDFSQSLGSKFGVIAGAQVWWRDAELGRQYRTAMGFPHPQHETLSLVNDIAVIKVDCPFDFNANVQPVNLPRLCNLDEDFVDLTGKIAGWGAYDDWFFTLSDDLQHAFATVISNEDCEDFYNTDIDDCVLCTIEDDTNGPCYGDYGGALVVPTSDLEDCGEPFPSSSSSDSSHSHHHDSSYSHHHDSSHSHHHDSSRSHHRSSSSRRSHSSSHHDSSSREKCAPECEGCQSDFTMIAMYNFSPFASCLDNPAGYVRITCYVSWIYAITGMKPC